MTKIIEVVTSLAMFILQASIPVLCSIAAVIAATM